MYTDVNRLGLIVSKERSWYLTQIFGADTDPSSRRAKLLIARLTSVAGALHRNGVPVICLPDDLNSWINERLRVQANTALDGTE